MLQVYSAHTLAGAVTSLHTALTVQCRLLNVVVAAALVGLVSYFAASYFIAMQTAVAVKLGLPYLGITTS